MKEIRELDVEKIVSDLLDNTRTPDVKYIIQRLDLGIKIRGIEDHISILHENLFELKSEEQELIKEREFPF